MEFLNNNPDLIESSFFIPAIFSILIYWRLRIRRWRKILKKSVDYHIFHLASISRDSSIDETSRGLAQALLWGASKQLPLDIAGRGGRALWRSFRGDKTSLNTCGTVYYHCVMNMRSIDKMVIRLNDTLLSTFYRIYLLESFLSFAAVLYMDFTLAYYLLAKPETGTGRLFREMRINEGKLNS